MHMPCLTRCETTARATSAPLVLKASTQSLSTMPAFLASVSLIQTTRAAARQRQHQQIVGIGGVDAPLLMRRDEVEHDRVLPFGLRSITGLIVLVSIGGR